MDGITTTLRVIVSLGVVLGVIWYAHRLINNKKPAKKNAVTILGKQGLAAKASVVVIEAEGMRFVLGVTEHNVSVLHASEPLPQGATGEAFAEVLAINATVPSESEPEPEPESESESASEPTPKHKAARTGTPALVAGSVLSAETWKRTYAALRQGPVR